MLFFGLSTLSWVMSSKNQLYQSTRTYCNLVRCLHISGLPQAEGIIGLFLSARRGRARDSLVVSLPTQEGLRKLFFLITSSPEAANWWGKDIFLPWGYLPNVGGGILNNFWSAGLFPMYFRMNTTCPSFWSLWSRQWQSTFVFWEISERDFSGKWVVGLGDEAAFLQPFCTAGLKCTGNPLHLLGVFWLWTHSLKYYFEVMTQAKNNPKDLVLKFWPRLKHK